MKEAPFKKALKYWTKLGYISFGGPAGQIAIMHQEVVERQNWIGENQVFRALNFCMLLPGPEAQQLATYIGWRLHGTLGGIIAGCLFVIPLSKPWPATSGSKLPLPASLQPLWA
jgi:chromate transporter